MSRRGSRNIGGVKASALPLTSNNKKKRFQWLIRCFKIFLTLGNHLFLFLWLETLREIQVQNSIKTIFLQYENERIKLLSSYFLPCLFFFLQFYAVSDPKRQQATKGPTSSWELYIVPPDTNHSSKPLNQEPENLSSRTVSVKYNLNNALILERGGFPLCRILMLSSLISKPLALIVYDLYYFILI